MSSPESGFLVKCRLTTRNNNATDMNAAITLAFNWFCYLFYKAILRLGQNCVEPVTQLAIVSDVFYHIADSEFRQEWYNSGYYRWYK